MKLFSMSIRILITVFPILVVFVIGERYSSDIAAGLLYAFSLIQLLSLVCRSGIELYVNQVFSIKLANPQTLTHLFKLIAIQLILAAAILVILTLLPGELVLQGANPFLLATCIAGTSVGWILISFLQALKKGTLGLLIGQIVFHILLLAALFIDELHDTNDFLVWYAAVSSLTVTFLLILSFRAKEYIDPLMLDKTTTDDTPGFTFTPSLWLSNFTGRGRTWLFQVLASFYLADAEFVSFMLLFRFAQIPMAALVGSGYLAQSSILHNDDALKILNRYRRLIGLNMTLALGSIAAIPLYEAFTGVEILSTKVFYLAWLLGFSNAIFGPVGVILNICRKSSGLLLIRIAGFGFMVLVLEIIQHLITGKPDIAFTAVFYAISLLELVTMLSYLLYSLKVTSK